MRIEIQNNALSPLMISIILSKCLPLSLDPHWLHNSCQLYFKETEKQKAVTEKLLDEFNLQHLRSLNASVLSGGEVRRVMLARLMINKPKIVLLDEPLAALDPQIIQDIQKYILKIQSSGTAVLITDHNVRNLFDITDRSYVISEGNVIAEGTSRELLKSSKAIEHYFGSQFS